MDNSIKNSLLQITTLQLGRIKLNEPNNLIQGVQFLNDFIENSAELKLCAYFDDKENLTFSYKMPEYECEKIIVFKKIKSLTITSNNDEENFFKNLQINTISGKPILDLFEFVNNVIGTQFEKHYNKDTKRSIFNLQTNLKALILSENSVYPIMQEPLFLKYVNSWNDEIKYWEIFLDAKSDKIVKKSAENFINLLTPVQNSISVFESLPINEIEDLLEKCHNILDDLWRSEPQFPKERILNLMDIIGSNLFTHTIKHLKNCDIWIEADYNKIMEKLMLSIQLGDKWLNTCEQLTGLFWPGYGLHPWKDGIYQPNELIKLVANLREVLNIRTIHKQLLRLSTKDEQTDLNNERIFLPFRDLDIITSFTESTDFLKARKEFEYLLKPAEERVAGKLKKQLMAVNANTRQLIYEFTRYSELINRPVLKNVLQAERKFLLNSLPEYIIQIQNESNLDGSKMMNLRHETSEIIKEIIFIRQLETKANEANLVAAKLLNDLDGYENLKEFISGVITDLKTQHLELFDSWSSDIISNINSNKLSLKETDPVVEFSKDKLMKVNYPTRLISLITEVRQLKSMRYHIPAKIEDTTEHAKKFLNFARLLEQISNFHNTIGDRMIVSQKPMMLNGAVELSKLVQEQEVVSWANEKAVEKYIQNLKRIVDKLSQSNTFLTSQHVEIIDKINELENVSLLKDFAIWIQTIKNLKNIVQNVENKGYRNMEPWKIHIDTKIAKILEKMYTTNLDFLDINLEEIHVDLVYRNSNLEYSPNKENLVKLYEQQINKYLNIPKHLMGISDDAAKIYAKICDRNDAVIEKVVLKKNELMDQLDAVIKYWKSWIQLEPIDSRKLTNWEHWDLHFRASKTFGQEIAKLPSTEERIGCFLINLARLRSDLESHNRSYWNQLAYTLKDSIAENVVKLQNYIDPSTAALTKQPVTMEEIGESGFNYTNISAAYAEMEATFNEMLNKSKTLSSWTREQVDSVNRLKGAWERLGNLINNHQHIMARQMETIKTTLIIEQENLLKEIERFEAKWTQINSVHHKSYDNNENSINGLVKLFEDVQTKRKEWDNVLQKKEKLSSSYSKFNLDFPNIKLIAEVENALNGEETSWKTFEEFLSEFQKLSSQYWIVFRKKYYELEDFIQLWEEKLTTNTDSQNIEYSATILQDLQKYKEIIPILKYAKGEDFSERHWSEMFALIEITPKAIDQILLKDFLEAHDKILQNAKELQNLCKNASSEIIIRQALKDIDQWDVQTKFNLISHSDSQGKTINLVKEFKELLNAIGDHQILLQSLKNAGGAAETFIEKASVWENKLENLNSYLILLAQIQKKWVYLEPIFSGGTLAQEKTRFDRLDRDFRKIMDFIEKNVRVTEISKYPNLKLILQTIIEQLNRCQQSLNSFLKEKREIFPRFFFLSDDDLLEIVGQAFKEEIIQSHLKKLFSGIHSVRFNNSGTEIIAIKSLQGEIVFLSNAINLKCPVEEWLKKLVQEMQLTLKELLLKCLKETQPDPLKYPSQILCLCENLNFTAKCDQAIGNMTLPAALAKYKSQLNELSSMELNNNESDEGNVLELKLKSLLLDTIHHVRVLEELLHKNVTKIQDWIWQKQLRYYANSTGDVTIKMAKAQMNYSYEYLGNEQKLVTTPLTERCFLTLTQAMYLGLGGNPYGPAGTGKTESVKALGAILGRQVLVFNCDEGIDINSMERILTGLTKTGAWGCFDEFNRLDETTLSAISMHIQAIQEALKLNSNKLNIGIYQDVNLDKHCSIFVTLNPASEGYGGRNRLPDNLKQLFRPVVMTHPDHEEITRTTLYCDGFRYAEIIAKKIVEIFDAAAKILSKQQHYDWGLRAIKSVLCGCKNELKMFRKELKITELSAIEEMSIVVATLQTDIISKLTFSDTIKFKEVLQSVFKDCANNNDKKTFEMDDLLKKALIECFDELNLEINQSQIVKCIEFYKQLKQRMGVAIIGPPMSGKTTIRNLLTMALSKLNEKIKVYNVNPKCMPRQQFLGHTDQLNQWNDGVLTNYSQQVASETEDIWSWIVCDGDVDPDWVESLNSVLDDNRLMTLPSGWRIHFSSNVNFIFETHNVENVSPATISRIGIVYLSSEDVKLADFVNKIIKNFNEDQRSYVEPLINDYYIKAIAIIMNETELLSNRSLISIAKTGLISLENIKSKPQFTVALFNGLGQQLKADFRQLFGEKLFDMLDANPPASLSKIFYDEARDLIDNYYTDSNIAIEKTESDDIPLIKTGQILRYLDILKNFLATGDKKQHLLLIGPHGSAKRIMIHNLLNDQFNDEMVEISCMSSLSTNYVIHKLYQYCISVNTFNGQLLKPKKGRLILYIRNLHLLAPDKWGTNMVIEFLNQLVEYKGFFNAKLEFVQIEGILVIGTMLNMGAISSRFLSKFHLINIEIPDKEDLSIILVSYLTHLIKSFFPTANFQKSKVIKLISTMLSIYEKIQSLLFRNDSNRILKLGLHHLVKWCKNLKYYTFSSETSQFESFLLEITCYEALRIFQDSVIAENEKLNIQKILDEAFKITWDLDNITQQLNYVYFIPRMDSNNVAFEKYTRDSWNTNIEYGINQYNKESQKLDIILNEEILFITSAVMRSLILSNSSNQLLIGKSGVGRKSAIKIASALMSIKIIYPASGDSPLFENDLKLAIQYAGIECENVILLLEDHIFNSERIFTLINQLISSGDVFNLYTEIEMESCVKGLKEKLDVANFDGDLYNFFATNIKKHLHVFICLDEENEILNTIHWKCPEFISNCNFICLNKWSNESIKNLPTKLNQTTKDDLTSADSFFQIYQTLPQKTPFKYISMIKLFYAVYKEKENSINSKITKLESGVSKLNEAQELVVELKQKAEEEQKKLAEKQEKANSALDMISSTIKGANEHKEEMEILKKRTESENVQLVKRKAEIEQELAEVEPLIQQARAAVGNIKTESLSEIRSLRAPPEIIRDILEGVLKLMGTQDTSWNSMKTFLAKRGVKEEIRSFDASRIQTENRVSVEKLMTVKKDSFDQKFAKRASVVAAPLAAWVEANVKYSKVLDKIRPLEREQHKLKENLQSAEGQLEELNTNLSDVDLKVAKLKEHLSQYTKEAAQIEIGLNEVNQTLNSSENLVNKLADEYGRWKEQLLELSHELEHLPNNSLLSAAFIIFLAEAEEAVRRATLAKWSSHLNLSKNFDFMSFLSSEREQLLWQSEDLPNDKVSLENVAILKKGFLCPILLDPHSSASNWVKKHYKKNNQNFEHISCGSSKFNTVLEAAIRFGKILLIEELDQIPANLFALIRNDLILQNERKLIRIYGKLIDYNENFKLILCSRNENIELPPELVPYLNILNFNVTYSGFIEQLLSSAIAQEKPELELRRTHLLNESETLQEKLYSLQMQILDCLSSSRGNILNDKNLLNILNDTKSNSTAVSEALKESTRIQNTLREEYEIYLDISQFGSKIYFACKEFIKIDKFCSLSTKSFIRLFLKCLQTTAESQNVELRRKHLLQIIYNSISRSMFKNIRLAFLLHIIYRMFDNAVPEKEMSIFLKQSNVQGRVSEALEIPPWIPSGSVQAFANLKASFLELYEKCQFNERNLWINFMDSQICEKEFPKHCELTEFQKVLIVQILRPEKLLSFVEAFCLKSSGLRSVDSVILNLQTIYNESFCEEPILLITTAGMDPSREIYDLAKQLNHEFLEISMGQGSEIKAINCLEECKKTGKWLILKNLQLVTYWLPILAENVKQLINMPSSGEKKFRLWLISEQTEKFNVVLAQNSLKIAYEEPEGISNNVQRIYTSLSENYPNKLNRTSARLIFIFTYFHALLQERRNYIPQGWSKFYEFNQTDLQTALNLTNDLWNNVNSNQIQWTFISGLLNEAVYGGRIECIDDLSILDTYLKLHFKDEILSHKWKPAGLNISLPNSDQLKDYLDSVKQFPHKDFPIIFGLPENINKTREKQLALKLTSLLNSFYNEQEIFSTLENQINFKDLHRYFSLWKKLNSGHDFIRQIIQEAPTKFDSSLQRFLYEEYLQGINLIQIIHKCFMNLNKISKNLTEPDQLDLIAAKFILQSKTPTNWLKYWLGPKDVIKYLTDLLKKTIYLSTCIESSDIENFLKNPIKLGLFFNPQTFLACCKQDRAKTLNASLDEVSLHTTWQLNPKISSYLLLSDLLIEGGLIENKALKPCKSNSEIINIVPNCYLHWTKTEKIDQSEEIAEYPLYVSANREHKIANIQIESDETFKEHGILSGIAFYLGY